MQETDDLTYTNQVVGYPGGFVAVGEILRRGVGDEGDNFWPLIWTSRDGIDWKITDPASLVTPCEGWVPRVDLSLGRAWTDGERVVVFGDQIDVSTTVCGSEGYEGHQSIAWLTKNALDWESGPLSLPGINQSQILDAWTYDGRWEAVAEPADYSVPGKPLVLQSSIGTAWSLAAELDITFDGQTTMKGAVGADGTRIIALQPYYDGPVSLRTSRDGKTWTDLTAPFAGSSSTEDTRSLQHVIAPTRESNVWAFTFSVGDACGASDERAEVWTSTDLQNWAVSPFPWVIARIDYMVVTRLGLIGRGGPACDVTGGPGPETPDGDRLFISRDGVSWQPLPPDHGQASGVIVDGPGGVLLVDGLDVWRLLETTD